MERAMTHIGVGKIWKNRLLILEWNNNKSKPTIAIITTKGFACGKNITASTRFCIMLELSECVPKATWICLAKIIIPMAAKIPWITEEWNISAKRPNFYNPNNTWIAPETTTAANT